jgi:hypothetical protein
VALFWAPDFPGKLVNIIMIILITILRGRVAIHYDIINWLFIPQAAARGRPQGSYFIWSGNSGLKK